MLVSLIIQKKWKMTPFPDYNHFMQERCDEVKNTASRNMSSRKLTISMEIKERSKVTRSTFCGSWERYLKFVLSITHTCSLRRILSATYRENNKVIFGLVITTIHATTLNSAEIAIWFLYLIHPHLISWCFWIVFYVEYIFSGKICQLMMNANSLSI